MANNLEKRACRFCNFCKIEKTAQVTKNNQHGSPRSFFYCNHPDLVKIPKVEFGYRYPGYIGANTSEPGSQLTIKTHPKWCPIEYKFTHE